MRDYCLRYKRMAFSAFSVLLLSCSLSAVAAPTQCPQPSLVRYDQAQGRFVAKDTAGLLWRSEVMAALNPVPALTAHPCVAVGKAKHVRISCPYGYAGDNRVILLPQDVGMTFALANAKAWTGHATATYGYFSCKTTHCQFTPTKK